MQALLNAASMINCFGVEGQMISITYGSHCLVTMAWYIAIMFLLMNTGDHKLTHICSESRETEKLNATVLSMPHKTRCY